LIRGSAGAFNETKSLKFDGGRIIIPNLKPKFLCAFLPCLNHGSFGQGAADPASAIIRVGGYIGYQRDLPAFIVVSDEADIAHILPFSPNKPGKGHGSSPSWRMAHCRKLLSWLPVHLAEGRLDRFFVHRRRETSSIKSATCGKSENIELRARGLPHLNFDVVVAHYGYYSPYSNKIYTTLMQCENSLTRGFVIMPLCLTMDAR